MDPLSTALRLKFNVYSGRKACAGHQSLRSLAEKLGSMTPDLAPDITPMYLMYLFTTYQPLYCVDLFIK